MFSRTTVPAAGELTLRQQRNCRIVHDWRDGLPTLSAGEVVLREVRPSDAHSLVSLLTTPEITRFISAPPQTVEGFERFIAASQRMRAAGQGACFAVTLRGYDTAIGIFQIRQVSTSAGEPGQLGGSIAAAEWGFAIGSEFWGSGLFAAGAELVIEFAFDVIGIHRLEARSAIANGRGNGALRKIGAVQEGILRKSFLRGGKYLDQALWSIVDEDWYRSKAVWGVKAS